MRWELLTGWLGVVEKKYAKVPFTVYEIRSILERHCVTALCYHGSNWPCEEDFSKLESEVMTCKKVRLDDKKLVIDSMKKLISEMCAVQEGDVKGVIGMDFSYGKFRPVLKRELVEYFRKFEPAVVVEMLLRYECLSPQGQQWAVPKAWLDMVRDTVGLDVIAFSSPLNNQVYGTDTKFFTGYVEDAPFGSLGSFLNVGNSILDEFTGRKMTIEVNPPFIEDVLRMTAKVLKHLYKYASEMKDPVQLTTLFITPHWTDAEFYKYVHSKLAAVAQVKEVVLASGKYRYENATTGEFIVARQPSFMFILTLKGMDSIDVPLDNFVLDKQDNPVVNKKTNVGISGSFKKPWNRMSKK